MDELVNRITAAAGLDAETARNAIGMVLGFLNKEAPGAPVDQLINALPGAQEAVAQAADAPPAGGLMGMVGGLMGGGMGGVMALGSQLMAQGLSMGQVETLGRELFAFGREKVGEDVMGQIVAAVPGLSRFA
jgi:predicted lipid-binding transport protein (Tim44 family)